MTDEKEKSKYMMLVTKEDFGNNVIKGVPYALVFGDTYSQLYNNGKYKGWFAQLYDTRTLRIVGCGAIDDTMEEVIATYETRVNFRR